MADRGVQIGEHLAGHGLLGRVARNSLWNIGGFIFTVLFSLITIRLYVTRLEADVFGLLMLLRIIITPLNLLDFGSTPAAVKYIAESEGRGDREQTGRYLHTALSFSLMVGGIGALLLVMSADVLVTRVFSIPLTLQNVGRLSIYWIAVRWFIQQATSTFSGVPTALQRYDLTNIGNVASNTLITVGGLVGLYRGGRLLDLIYYETIVAALMVCGWIFMVHKLLPDVSLFPRWDWVTFRRMFRFGFWQTIESMGSLFGHEAERFILGVLTSVAAVGFYTVSWNLASRVYSVSYSLGQVLFPMVSTLVGQGRQRESRRVVLLAGWLLTMVSISLLVPLAVLAQELLLVWLGPVYATHSFVVLRLVSISAVGTSAFIVPSFFLMGIGETKWLAFVAIVQGTITIAFSLILIPRFGLEGAAWGVVVASGTHLVVLLMMWKRFFREDVSFKVYLSSYFPNVAVGIILTIIFSIVWDSIGGQAGLGLAGLYGAGLFFLALTFMLSISRLTPGWADRQALLWRLLGSVNQIIRRSANLENVKVEP
jgi:O-antigen/teichoic acid export membrane protein